MSFESWWNDQDRVRDGESNKKVCKIIWERIEISNHTKIKELENKLKLANEIIDELVQVAEVHLDDTFEKINVLRNNKLDN